MQRLTQFLAVLLMAGLLSGCGSMKLQDFAEGQPQLDLFDWFSGQSTAWGVFEDRFGTIRRQFKVELNGRIEGEELILVEDFVYADGEVSQRIWTIRRDGAGGYVGKAPDIVGEATGRAAGNAVNWRYTMDLKVGDGSWRVKFDDWMLLQADGVLINRAWVSKLGINIGSVSLFFSKKESPQSSAG